MVGGEYTQRRNAERSLKLPLNALARSFRFSRLGLGLGELNGSSKSGPFSNELASS